MEVNTFKSHFMITVQVKDKPYSLNINTSCCVMPRLLGPISCEERAVCLFSISTNYQAYLYKRPR